MENPTPSTGTASQMLPGAWSIITDSWKLFVSTWNKSVQTSRLLILVGVAYLIGGILASINPALSVISGVISFVAAIYTLQISIRVILAMLNLEAGKDPLPADEANKKAWSLLGSLIWIAFLMGLATFGASLLLILPGIYLAIALHFSQIILIDQGIRGTQALAASRALIKGRWWPTFWRILVGGFIFGALMFVVVGAVMGVLGVFTNTSLLAENRERMSLATGIMQFLQTIALAALVPLFTGFQVKLYRALQKTR